MPRQIEPSRHKAAPTKSKGLQTILQEETEATDSSIEII
jgi:hypothetical protein